MTAERPAVVQRRRKPPGDRPERADKPGWHDWRRFESEALALAAIVFDMRQARAYEYRLKPDPFAIAPTNPKKNADTSG
jgi:hypothetical protein